MKNSEIRSRIEAHNAYMDGVLEEMKSRGEHPIAPLLLPYNLAKQMIEVGMFDRVVQYRHIYVLMPVRFEDRLVGFAIRIVLKILTFVSYFLPDIHRDKEVEK